MYYSNALEKNDKIKDRAAHVMKKQVLLSVCCQVQGKEKQKIWLPIILQITRKYKYHVMTCGSFHKKP